MRVVLEKMDWGNELTPEQKAKPTDIESPRKEALIRFGRIGADVLADDDDVVIVIAPQNVVGAMVIDLLDDMCKSAAGRPGDPPTLITHIYTCLPVTLRYMTSPVILFNPSISSLILTLPPPPPPPPSQHANHSPQPIPSLTWHQPHPLSCFLSLNLPPSAVILLNPSLGDRPSSNNLMQIRGRSERRAIQDSFVDIFTVRLLYPSSGGYFPLS